MMNAVSNTWQTAAIRLCLALAAAACVLAAPAKPRKKKVSYLREQAQAAYVKKHAPKHKTPVRKKNAYRGVKRRRTLPMPISLPQMTRVEGGTFLMGCMHGVCGADENPWHPVAVSSFYIGKYEVTQREWNAVMGKKKNPSAFKNDACPVENVSWDDVQKFIERLNKRTGKRYRLPTEAEWEYAARGGSRSRSYIYSGSNHVDRVAWYARKRAHPVGRKLPNELGIHDMSGNVWEWCADRYGAYQSAVQYNPKGAQEGGDRVIRGGSWVYSDRFCRISNRFHAAPDSAYINLGFRLAHPIR